eukprot:gene9249-10905_t
MKTQWPTALGNSQNTGQTSFSGPNSNYTITTNMISGGIFMYPFYETTVGLLIGPDGMMITAFYSDSSYQGHIVAYSSSGNLLWDHVFNGYGSPIRALLANNLVCVAGYFGFYPSLSTLRHGLACLDLAGNLVWTAMPSVPVVWFFACRDALVAYGGTMWLYSFNTTSGVPLWNTTDIVSVDSAPAVSVDGSTFYFSSTSTMWAYTCKGEFLWEYAIAGAEEVSSPVVSHEGVIFFGVQYANRTGEDFFAKYVAVNSMGAEIWTTPGQHSIYGIPTVGNGRLVVASGDGILALSSNSGNVLWSTNLLLNNMKPETVQRVTMDQVGNLYVTYCYKEELGHTGYLSVLSLQGRTLYSSPPFNAPVSAPVVNSFGNVIILTALDPNNNSPMYFQRFVAGLGCADGSYDPKKDGEGCRECTYPYTNYKSGQYDCPNVWLKFNLPLVLVIFATLSFIVLVGVLSGERKVAIFLVILFPTLDFFSDLAYIMTNKFHDIYILVFAVILVLTDAVIYARQLYSSPRYPACGLAFPHGAVTLMKHTMGLAKGCGTKLDSILPAADVSALHGLIIWTVVYSILFSFITLVSCIVFGAIGAALLLEFLLRVPLVVLLFFLGAVLHATKALCIGRVWYCWVRMWSGLSYRPAIAKFGNLHEFDTAAYNGSLLTGFLFESFPQLILQAVNNKLIGAWSEVAIFSTILSMYMTLDGFYRLCFSLCVQCKRLVDIPVKPPVMSLFYKDTEMKGGSFRADGDSGLETYDKCLLQGGGDYD